MKIAALFLLFFPFETFLSGQTTVNYSPSATALPSPERGFYLHTETHSAQYDPLDASALAALRNGYTSDGANYTTPVTLILRVFYLESFTASGISGTYLNKMQADFNAARTAGVKMIVRFAYTQDTQAPYNDAPKSRVLSHIAQLAPLLSGNADVIAAVQLGFIGAWGEGYYTDYFGDPSQPPNQITAPNWADRTEVLNALLAAVPATRQVQVRTPQYKQKAVYGPGALVTSAPSGGRIGHHNDCFLAPFADGGTYTNYDIPVDDTLHLKPYTADDTALQLAMGGETCEPNGVWHRCQSAGGQADTELKRFHYSYLNADYNHDVNNAWTPCFSSINNRLGYRFALQQGTYPNTATGGGAVDFSFSVKNEGYAKPFNTRPLEFILRNTGTSVRYYAAAAADPGDWPPGAVQGGNETFCLPGDMPAGNYELLLNMPDPYPSLYANPDYSIQLANAGVWESSTGYNKLAHTITVSGSNGGCAGHPFFTLASGVLPVELINFYGENREDGVHLFWATGSEQNASHFEIQRSGDAVAFETVGTAATQGSAAHYTFPDKTRPPGVNLFYRLKTVDSDGSSSNGKIILIASFEKPSLRILQNPVRGALRFRLDGSGNSASAFDFKIVAADGRTVMTGQSEGEIPAGSLPGGWYSLWVAGYEGPLAARFLKEN